MPAPASPRTSRPMQWLATISKLPLSHLGLLYEREGRAAESFAHLSRARELDSEAFPAPVRVDEEAFMLEVNTAISELPPALAALLQQATLELADLPATGDLAATMPPFSPTILGLYRGLPAAENAGMRRSNEALPGGRVGARGGFVPK